MKRGQLLGTVMGLLLFANGQGAPDASQPETQVLIEGLGSDQFAVREAAQEDLATWAGENFEERADIFLSLMEESEDPEIKARSRAILREAMLGRLDKEGPGFMGIVMSQLVARAKLDDKIVEGVGVERVQAATPAAKAGLQAGDLLVKVDDLPLDTPDGSNRLQQHVTEAGAGTKIVLQVVRGSELEDVPLVLMRTPLQIEFMRRNPRRFGSPLAPSEQDLRDKKFEQWLEERRKRLDNNAESSGATKEAAAAQGEVGPE